MIPVEARFPPFSTSKPRASGDDPLQMAKFAANGE